MSWGHAESKVTTDDTRWDAMFELLLEYGKIHGDYNVAERYACTAAEAEMLPDAGEAPVRLGKWLQRQRHSMRTKTLKDDRMLRMQALVDAGLLLVDEAAEADLSWQRHYSALTDYAQAFQHCNIPYAYEVIMDDSSPSTNKEVLQLGRWLHNQRHAHNRSDRLLRPDRAAQLQVSNCTPLTRL